MSRFLATFKTGFKFLWSSPVSVTILTAFPIVLIFILGNALSSYISVETELDPIPVAVAADKNGALAQFLLCDEISGFFELTFTDEQSANALVRNGDAEAAVIEKDGDTKVLLTPGNGVASELTLAIVDSYKQMGAAAAIAAAAGRNVYELLETEVGVQSVPLGKRVPGAMDYYAVTMLVMILMYSGLNGHELFAKSVTGETGARIRLTPISSTAHIGGLLASSTVTSFLQGLIVFAFTGLVYGVYWGERIPLVLLTLFAVIFFSQSLCIMFSLLIKNSGAVTGLAQGVFWIMTFVSKGYSRVDFGAADKVFQYVPSSLAHTVIFGAVYGGNESKMMLDLALLFGMGAVLFIPAFMLGRRRFA